MPKTRSKFMHKFLQNQGHSITFTNGGVDNSAGGSLELLKGYSVTVGDNYVDWRNRLKRNQQCTTSLDATEYAISSTKWIVNHTFKPKDRVNVFVPTYVTYNMFGDFIPTIPSSFASPTDKVSVTSADNTAKTKFLEDVRSKRTSFQGGVFFGEIRETLHMIRHPLEAFTHGLGDYLKALKKKRSGLQRGPSNQRVARAQKVIADTWLEYSFGWRPLLHDIDDAMKALAQITSGPEFQGASVIGHGSDKFTTSQQLSVASAGTHKHTAMQITEFSTNVKYYGFLGNTMIGSMSWDDQLGLNIEQFLPTIWELIPYSFLIDYFANIGDMIYAASTNTTGLNWVARTQVDRTVLTVFPLNPGLLSVPSDLNVFVDVVSDADNPKLIYSYKKISRAPYNGSLVPSLKFQVPGRWNRYVNIAALLAGGKVLQPFVR